jgi:hypothetical protein
MRPLGSCSNQSRSRMTVWPQSSPKRTSPDSLHLRKTKKWGGQLWPSRTVKSYLKLAEATGYLGNWENGGTP